LIEDAMFIYSSKRPIVIGHEYLSEFIQAHFSQPLVVKIHRDLYLAPKNSENNTRVLNDSMRKQLSHILRNYTPIVIGYGANDGSLIDFLDELKPQDMNGGMFWCSVPPEVLHNKVKRVIEKCNGFEIKIDGFDEFMINLGDEMGFQRLDQIIMDTALRRAEQYRNQVWKVKNKKTPSSDINQAITNIIKRSKTDWWTFETEAASAANSDEKEKIYLKGLKETHNCPELLVNYAVFLKNTRKDYSKAEQYFTKALNMFPNNSDVLGNYANFLWEIKQDTTLADTFYKKALEENPSNVNVLGNYAVFLEDVLHDYNQAERYYQEALKLEPTNVKLLSNFATFLHEIQNHHEQAEEYYQKAYTIDPTNLPNIGNYAKLLIETGKYKEARKFIDLAFATNKVHPLESLELEVCFYALAIFPLEYPEVEDRIEALLEKGVKSVGWNLEPILTIAKVNNHPKYIQLKDFARRITQIE
jgi:Tfp pilus assembly protein PilF